MGRALDLAELHRPTEYLLGLGGDVRIQLDAATGLNAYGCSPRPRPWAITFASSTASSISERGYEAADGARVRLVAYGQRHGVEASLRREVETIRAALRRHYALDESTAIVLTPSGTDGELAALAIALLGDPSRPIANVLVAPEESGTGVPLAATGCHFAIRSARGVDVTKGGTIDGFPAETTLVTVAARTDEGAIRPIEEVDAECSAKVMGALAEGRRPLLHVMDQTKTGLLVPSEAAVARLGADANVDVVVDACQARLSAATVRAYLDRGAMVLVTGSKFFTGPPFAGALLLPKALAARLDGDRPIPGGLADYFGRFDWPEGARACVALPADANVGLVLRWHAALAEMAAFAALGDGWIAHVLSSFASRVGSAIDENPDLFRHRAPPLVRAIGPNGWDTLPTIFPFSIRTAGDLSSDRPWRDVEEARAIYTSLNSDLSDSLPSTATDDERTLAGRLVHLGQPVALALPDGRTTGALRICAGARLVSGEPSLRELDRDTRLAHELDDAVTCLAKISLILRYESSIRASKPRPSFRGRGFGAR